MRADPLEVRDAERQRSSKPAAVTFQRCSILYMAHEARLATCACPTIGALPIDAVNTSHVMQILTDPPTAWRGGPRSAAAVRPLRRSRPRRRSTR